MNGVTIMEPFIFRDARGELVKLLVNHQMGGLPFGESYFIRADPGAVRGNHYHEKTTEWFCVLDGEAELKLKDMRSGETDSIICHGSEIKVIRVDKGIAHALIIREKACIVIYADRPYDPNDTDTIGVTL